MNELPYRQNISTETKYSALRNFAPEAIANHIDAAMNEPFQKETTGSIVRRIAELSLSIEERKLPTGRIVFVRHSGTWVDPSIRLDNGIDLSNLKLLRKVLTAVKSGTYYLVANERRVMGFSNVPIPDDAVIADFQGQRTLLTVRQSMIAELRNGKYYAGLPEVDLSLIENHIQQLCGANADKVIRSIRKILEAASAARHGCTIVITDKDLSGRNVQPVIDTASETELELICNMAAIDGALHIRDDGNVHAFGCLLDGMAVPDLEDPSRGARYNSAIRYTKGSENSLVITASEDGPITAFAGGHALTPSGIGLPPQLPGTLNAPLALKEWLVG